MGRDGLSPYVATERGRPRAASSFCRRGLGIGSGTDEDIVAFDCADQGFSHSIALRTFDGRRSRFKPDLASEAAGITCNVAACRPALYALRNKSDAARYAPW
jgi:hypothetical protein